MRYHMINEYKNWYTLATPLGARLIVCGHSHIRKEKLLGDTLLSIQVVLHYLRDGTGGTFAIVTYEDGVFDVKFKYKRDII